MSRSSKSAPAFRIRRGAGALAALALAAVLPLQAHEDQAGGAAKEEITIVAEQVSGGVYMLTGRGGNIGLSVGPDGVFMIDDQYAPLTEAILEAIRKLSDQPIRFVLNTHWHGDHTGGNENLGNAGALIVAHDNVRERLRTDQSMPFFGREVPASPAAALPVVTFSDALSFHLNGEDIRALHFPAAHTDGDAVVQFRGSNVVHMGDIYFNGLYPFIDSGSGGSIRGMVAAIDQVLPLMDADTRVIPGHGPLSNRDELAAYRNMLADVADRISALLAEGKDLAAIQAAAPTAAYDADWGGGFINAETWVRMIVEDLAR
jgi:glyoxylase-like metal-dependent hydrolase (beta-lactamase superfamily II)